MTDLTPILRTDHKAVDKRDELRTVMGWIAGESRKVPIVMDGEKPIGILNERALMSRRLDQKAHIEPYMLPTKALPLDAPIDKVRARMSEFRAAYLPVEDKRGRLAGYVAAVDVARQTLNGARASDLALPVAGLREAQTMGEALNLFGKEYVDFLPITRENGRVAGVLPRRTVLRMELEGSDKGRRDAAGEKMHPLKDPVGGFMEQTPVFVLPNAGGAELLDTLDESGYAIVQGSDGRMLGMVTPETLFRAVGQ